MSDVADAIKRLDISDGDVVVVKGHFTPEVIVLLNHELTQLDKQVTILQLQPGQSIETLNEEVMLRAGWVRKEK